MRFCLFLVAAATVSVVLPFWAIAAPAGTRPVLVVVAPWASAPFAADLVGRAGGAILGATGRPWIVLARSDAPDFAARLGAAGAWFVLDAAGLAGCMPRPITENTGS